MTSQQSDTKTKDWGAKEISFAVIGICVLAYIVIFLAWNFTSPDHKPSSLLWDSRKEGYEADPLGDRYQNK